MRKSGLPVPAAALLSGFVAASVAAQDFERNSPASSPASFAPAKAEPLAGNPLWTIPISELTETQARPLFYPSRRPPAVPVLAALASLPEKPAPPRKPEPDHPLLTLVGTIVSQSVEIGVFVDETSHDLIRLKAGDIRDGWMLSSVVGRAAFFQKEGYRAATLALPAPGSEPTSANGRTAPPVVQPVAGVLPANAFEPVVIPAATKGGSGRPPKEG